MLVICSCPLMGKTTWIFYVQNLRALICVEIEQASKHTKLMCLQLIPLQRSRILLDKIHCTIPDTLAFWQLSLSIDSKVQAPPALHECPPTALSAQPGHGVPTQPLPGLPRGMPPPPQHWGTACASLTHTCACPCKHCPVYPVYPTGKSFRLD